MQFEPDPLHYVTQPHPYKKAQKSSDFDGFMVLSIVTLVRNSKFKKGRSGFGWGKVLGRECDVWLFIFVCAISPTNQYRFAGVNLCSIISTRRIP